MGETKRLTTNMPTAIAEAAALLRRGDLVVFPTDTVYGAGADAFNATAVAQLYKAKQRPFNKGIPILLADLADIDRVADDVPPLAQTYIRNFWPGALTLILPRNLTLPAIISPDETIAVRMPDCDTARRLIRAAGGAVAATSANLSGEPPTLTGDQALAALDGLVTAVLDDGAIAAGGLPSTIVDCTRPLPKIIRRGPIAAADLKASKNE